MALQFIFRFQNNDCVKLESTFCIGIASHLVALKYNGIILDVKFGIAKNIFRPSYEVYIQELGFLTSTRFTSALPRLLPRTSMGTL